MILRFRSVLFVPCLVVSIFLGTAHAEEWDRGLLGLTTKPVKDATGLLVVDVVLDSPAAKAGIKNGDEITVVDGLSVTGASQSQIDKALRGAVGSTAKLTFLRQGSAAQEVSVVRQSFIETYLPGATAGDARAQFHLGSFHRFGPAPARDLPQAASWYRKAADQGYAPAERRLGNLYEDGLGVAKDPKTAFSWYLKAAAQDNSAGEADLASCYRGGVGTTLDNWNAFNWYYRSAVQDDPYGEWGLAYMYEYGLGTKKDIGEAARWYLKAQAALPQNEKLKRIASRVGFKAFLEDPASLKFDLALFRDAAGPEVLFFFCLLGFLYLAGAATLLYFSFRTTEAPTRLSISLGWIAFYIESQGFTMAALFLFGKSLTADTLMVATSIFSVLPVIASTLGPVRFRFWKASKYSFQELFLMAVCAMLITFVFIFAYAVVYHLFVHSNLPAQSTHVLIGKTKQGSSWLAYVTIALAIPAAEEIIFRGYLFEALRRWLSGNNAILVSAFAFSACHLQPLYFVPLFGLGLMLGWIRQKTDSLRLPVLLHALNNCLALALLR
jgi:membrane protease YdiL (CAAX protease family)